MRNFIILLIAIALLVAFAGQVFAAEQRPGKIYWYQNGNGTLSFIAQDIDYQKGLNWKISGIPAAVVIEAHKVMTAEKTYYAIRACVTGKAAENTQIASVAITLDGKEFTMNTLPVARKDKLDFAIQEWYAVDSDLLAAMSKVQKIRVVLKTSNGKVYDNNPDKSFAAALRRLDTMNRDNYQSQDEVVPMGPMYFLFIPSAKPDEIGQALTYKMNYMEVKGKEEFLRGLSYEVKKNADWSVAAFENESRFFKDGFLIFGGADRYDYPYIWVTMKANDRGTWLSFTIMGKTYRNGPASYEYIFPREKAPTADIRESDRWIEASMWVYKLYHGMYNYGMEWGKVITEKDVWKAMREEWKPGPFEIRKVDTAGFPELAEVKPGEQITAINGVSTANISYKESLFKTACSGKSIEFTIRDATGKQRSVTVKPKFEASKLTKKNYQEIISKNPRQIKQLKMDEDYPYETPMSYDPLG